MKNEDTLAATQSTVMFLTQFVVAASIFWQLSSAMSVPSPECAVVGCGVLGTSLCKQLLASPEFAGWKGMLGIFHASGVRHRVQAGNVD